MSEMCRVRTLLPYSILLLMGVIVVLGIPLPSWSSSSLQSYSRDVSATLSEASPEYSIDLVPFTFQAEITALSTNDTEIGMVLERIGDDKRIVLENLTSILNFSLVLDIGMDESEEGTNCRLSLFRMSADAVANVTLVLWFDSHASMAPPVPMAIFGVIFAFLGLSGFVVFERRCRNRQQDRHTLMKRGNDLCLAVLFIILAGGLLAPYATELYAADISTAPQALSIAETFESVTLNASEPLVTVDIFMPPPGNVEPTKKIYVRMEPVDSIAFHMVTSGGNMTWVGTNATLGTWLAIRSPFGPQRTLEISRMDHDAEIGLYEVVTGKPPSIQQPENFAGAVMAVLMLAGAAFKIGQLRTKLPDR